LTESGKAKAARAGAAGQIAADGGIWFFPNSALRRKNRFLGK
jgi:hypothetical protein